MSLGIPGQFDHPKFKEAARAAEAGILKSKVPPWVARTPDQAKELLDRGYRIPCSGLTGCCSNKQRLAFWSKSRAAVRGAKRQHAAPFMHCSCDCYITVLAPIDVVPLLI